MAKAFSRDLTIYHLDLSQTRIELWVASDITLAPFNSHAFVVTEFVVKSRQMSNF